MNRRVIWWVLVGLLAWPLTCPAPLIYRPGEGWTYEGVGGGKWQKARAKDQYDVAKEAFDRKNYRLTTKAARRTLKRWPLSDYAPQAQYLLGRAYEARRMDERAFKEYQKLIEKYPKADSYQEVINRQYEIANRYFRGQWFRIAGYVPLYPSKEKTIEMYAKVIKNGPYSQVAPQAQMKIGELREKQKDYPEAVKAYEKAADVYHDQKSVAADAQYKAGMAYTKEAKTAEYDQSVSAQAISSFNDFIVLYPNDSRVPQAQKTIATLKTEQARGSFKIAQFYELKKQWAGAKVYYNEVILKDPDSKYGQIARQRIDELSKLTAEKPAGK